MASIFPSYDLEFDVSEPHIIPAQTQSYNRPQPLFVKIELKASVEFRVVRHDCLTNRFTEASTDSYQETLRFPLHILRNQECTNQVLRPIFSRLRISPNSLTAGKAVDDFAKNVVRIRNRASNRGLHVLPLIAEFRGMLVEHVRDDERVMIRRALLESESELESNCGMVPAKISSVEKMLKRVRVEKEDDSGESIVKKRKVKGEDCVICLDEIKIGSIASRMPCSHTFHGLCIEKWLHQSHYCPVCRFEVPTSEQHIEQH